MIQLSGAGKRFGPKVLFEGLDWLITPVERAGIVGGNGTGKSTLLKVLGGMEGLDYGSINRMKGVKIGYLPQDGLSLCGRTVFAECMSVFDDLRDLEKEQETLTHQMSVLDHESAEYAQVADRFHFIETEFQMRGGYALDSQVGAVLTGLGFRPEDWARLTDEFSGGWQMRIALAKLLLEKPNLLLLDEPTNHLDIEARDWLEEYLGNYENAFILISHDRYFLDQTVKKTVEVWNKKVYFYSGTYTKYEAQKAERLANLQAAYNNQRDKIEQLEAFINRFRAQATKAKQVQSRIKELERIERIEVPPQEKTIHFRFPQPKPSGRVVAEFRGVSKSYGPKHVFSDAKFIIERGERIALAGINGAGKSTLIKILAGVEPVSSGEFTLGHNVLLDYFAQDQYKELDADAKMLDDLGIVAPRATNTELRGVLGSFLFSDDDVFKRIGVLSGGERNRYALARMLMMPGNFLLLDEPTNHLDMRAKDVLLSALQEFQGTVVFVSHDRYFLDQLATRVFEVGDGQVIPHMGNYQEYLWRKAKDKAAQSAADASAKASAKEEKRALRAELRGEEISAPETIGANDEGEIPATTYAESVAAEPATEHNGPDLGGPEPLSEQSEVRTSANGHHPSALPSASSPNGIAYQTGAELALSGPANGHSSHPPQNSGEKQRRVNPIKLQQMKKRHRSIEEDIARLEAEIAEYELELANYVSAARSAEVGGLLDKRRKELEALMAEWEEVAQTIEVNR